MTLLNARGTASPPPDAPGAGPLSNAAATRRVVMRAFILAMSSPWTVAARSGLRRDSIAFSTGRRMTSSAMAGTPALVD